MKSKDKILLNFVVIASQFRAQNMYVWLCGCVLWNWCERAAGVSFAALLISNFEARLGHNFPFTGTHTHTSSFVNWSVSDTHHRREISARLLAVDLWWDFRFLFTPFSLYDVARKKLGHETDDRGFYASGICRRHASIGFMLTETTNGHVNTDRRWRWSGHLQNS